MTEPGTGGTSGGPAGTNRAVRRLALALLAGFALILVAITIANAESMISEFAADDIPERAWHIWSWELTSIAAWITLMPVIWWAVARVRPPRLGWGVVAAIALAGLPLASAWHIELMTGLRKLIYAAAGEHYRFEGGLPHPYVYEFRKDLVTYLQFLAVAALFQWLLARAGDPAAVPPPAVGSDRPVLEVAEGAVTHRVPIDEIDHVLAAGNYVELAWAQRTLLHRATLAATEAALGSAFVRIHRSRLVRRAAVRTVETNQAGDFAVTLADGTVLKGSRRYRAGLDA